MQVFARMVLLLPVHFVQMSLIWSSGVIETLCCFSAFQFGFIGIVVNAIEGKIPGVVLFYPHALFVLVTIHAVSFFRFREGAICYAVFWEPDDHADIGAVLHVKHVKLIRVVTDDHFDFKEIRTFIAELTACG